MPKKSTTSTKKPLVRYRVEYPDGTAEERESQKVLTHAVIMGPGDAEEWQLHHSRQASQATADAILFTDALTRGEYGIEPVGEGDARDLKDGTTHQVWMQGVPETVVATNRKGLALVDGEWVAAQQLVRERVNERLAQAYELAAEEERLAQEGPPQTWAALHWVSRREAAVASLALALDAWGGRGYRLEVARVRPA